MRFHGRSGVDEDVNLTALLRNKIVRGMPCMAVACLNMPQHSFYDSGKNIEGY